MIKVMNEPAMGEGLKGKIEKILEPLTDYNRQNILAELSGQTVEANLDG